MEAGTWDGMARALSPDYRVRALDLRDHGQSDKAADLESPHGAS
jgi:pimeloyl-ACP methyl ester carboxylesterase